MPTLFDKSVAYLASHVEEILSKQRDNGEFWPDSGFPARWNTDYQQFAYYPLAWLYTLEHPANPWRGNSRLLGAVQRCFENNLRIQTDGGFWGTSHDLPPSVWSNEWRSFFWLRAWELVRDHLPAELVEQCRAGLIRALAESARHCRVSASEKGFGENHNVRNHPTWHFLAPYALGQALGDEPATTFPHQILERICAVQHPAGVWFEHDGPVTVYQHITMSALSHYQRLSGSAAALEAMGKALNYYRHMIYPDGTPAATLDGRVRYTGYVVSILPAAWTHFAEGRALLHFLLDKLLSQPLGAGYQVHGGWLGLPFFTQFAADLAALGATALEDPRPAVSPLVGEGNHELPRLPARVVRQGPWTVVLSGFTRSEAPDNRWALDYQAHCSIFHEKVGLIFGGGGGKRQAMWSLFTAGSRPLGLPCLASAGSVRALSDRSAELTLDYLGFRGVLQIDLDPDRLRLSAEVRETGGPVGPHFLQLPFLMKGPQPIVTATGRRTDLESLQDLMPEEIGDRLGREGKFLLTGLTDARALLGMLPYNTHWRNGWSPAEKAMGVVAQPLIPNQPRVLELRVPD